MTLASAAFLGLRGSGETGDPGDAINLGNRRELFVDRFLIDRMKGVELQAHPPRPAGMALEFDKPWEGALSGYVTVLQDGGKRRMYYRGCPLTGAAGATKEGKAVTCYAESSDGVHWVKPNLGLYEIHGARDNNVDLADAGPPTHNFCPFIDARPGVPGVSGSRPASRRFHRQDLRRLTRPAGPAEPRSVSRRTRRAGARSPRRSHPP